MRKILILGTACLGLTACGGGGTAMQEEAEIAPDVLETAETFPNGSVLAYAYNQPIINGANILEFDAIIIAPDGTQGQALAAILSVSDSDAGLTYNETETGNPNIYSVNATGTDADGNVIDATYDGIILAGDAGYVSQNQISVNGTDGIWATDGSSPFGNTPGTATYSGVLTMGSAQSGINFVTESGTFNLAVNFENQSASMIGTTATGSVNAPSLELTNNSIQAAMTGDATLSLQGSGDVAASTFGYFAGNDGAGVHGLAQEIDQGNAPISAMFYGERN